MKVGAAGLESWSTHCATAAANLALCGPVTADLPSGQATAAAVSASQMIAAAAARVLAGRVQSTGTKASIAAGSYVESDATSAHQLAEVPASMVV
jgi:hypothetical protein